MDYQAIGGFIAVFILIAFGVAFGHLWGSARKSKGVPNLQNIPPAPIQRYRTPTPTIETTYGQNLTRVSTEIFIKDMGKYTQDPSGRAKYSVLSAVSLLAEVEKVCFERDLEKAEKSSDDAIKAFQKPSETGVKP